MHFCWLVNLPDIVWHTFVSAKDLGQTEFQPRSRVLGLIQIFCDTLRDDLNEDIKQCGLTVELSAAFGRVLLTVKNHVLDSK